MPTSASHPSRKRPKIPRIKNFLKSYGLEEPLGETDPKAKLLLLLIALKNGRYNVFLKYTPHPISLSAFETLSTLYRNLSDELFKKHIEELLNNSSTVNCFDWLSLADNHPNIISQSIPDNLETSWLLTITRQLGVLTSAMYDAYNQALFSYLKESPDTLVTEINTFYRNTANQLTGCQFDPSSSNVARLVCMLNDIEPFERAGIIQTEIDKAQTLLGAAEKLPTIEFSGLPELILAIRTANPLSPAELLAITAALVRAIHDSAEENTVVSLADLSRDAKFCSQARHLPAIINTEHALFTQNSAGKLVATPICTQQLDEITEHKLLQSAQQTLITATAMVVAPSAIILAVSGMETLAEKLRAKQPVNTSSNTQWRFRFSVRNNEPQISKIPKTFSQKPGMVKSAHAFFRAAPKPTGSVLTQRFAQAMSLIRRATK